MNELEDIMLDLYNTLEKIRYPKITTTEPKNLQSMILTGENRISLLSWLLVEKSAHAAAALEKLEGTALEGKLLKFYSEIGICTEKDLLLGNCPIKEQVPTLRLLLVFMKNIYLEPYITYDTVESSKTVFQGYIYKDSSMTPLIPNFKSNTNYLDAMQYFKDIKENMSEYNKLLTDDNSQIKKELTEDNKQNIKVVCNEDDQDTLFCERKTKFIETFATVKSWPASNANHTESSLHCMDNDIKNIYTDFSILKEILEAKKEILKAVIPKELNKSNTPLDAIIEETLISINEISHEN